MDTEKEFKALLIVHSQIDGRAVLRNDPNKCLHGSGKWVRVADMNTKYGTCSMCGNTVELVEHREVKN